MGKEFLMEASVIGLSKVYQFEVELSAGKFFVFVASEVDKTEISKVCDDSKYAQTVSDYLLALKENLKGPVAIVISDLSTFWIATRDSGIWLIRDDKVRSLIVHDEWGSGFVVDKDLLVAVWGDIGDLGILDRGKQILALISVRMEKERLLGMLVKTKLVQEEELIKMESSMGGVREIERPIESETILDEQIVESKKSVPKWIYWLPSRESVDRWNAKFHMESYRPKGKGFFQIIGAVILVLLVVLGTLGWWRVQGQEIKGNWDQQVVSLNQKIDEAISIGKSNHIRAEGLLQDAEALLGKLSESGVGKDQIEILRIKINGVRSGMTGVYNVSPTTWFTLSLIRDGLTVDDVDYKHDLLWMLDKTGARIVTLNVETKSPEVVWGQDNVGGALTIAAGDKYIWWVDSQKVVAGSKKAISTGAWDASWGKAVDSGSFGDSYYLMTTKGIVKCSLKDKVLCENWLIQEAQEKWSGYNTMAIDGKIWVADGATIKRFASGVMENVNISGLSDPWGEIGKIVTDDKSKNIYVLDRGKKRVVAIEKETGIVGKSQSWEQMDTVVDLAVDEVKGRMWWVSSKVVYEMGLN